MDAGRRLALTGGAWTAVGLFSGFQLFVASGLGPAQVALGQALRLQLAAAGPWIPATYAAFALAAARPVARPCAVRNLALHLAAGLAAVVALNLGIAALQGLVAPAARPLGPRALEGILTQGHLALLVWAMLVAAGHLRPRRPSPSSEPLTLRDHRGNVLLPPARIRWIEAAGDYALVHAEDGGEHLVSARMAELERRLESHGFARVHRSAIVNLARVRRHFPRSHGDHVLVLDDGARVPLPRGRREAVLARLVEGAAGRPVGRNVWRRVGRRD